MLRTLVSACLLLSASAGAQSFEAASIKPAQPAADRLTGIQVLAGGRLNTFSTSLRLLIMYAYNVRDYQVSEVPADPAPKRTIVAKADGNATLRHLTGADTPGATEGSVPNLPCSMERKTLRYTSWWWPRADRKYKRTQRRGSRLGLTGARRVAARKASTAMFARLLGTLSGRPFVV